MCDLVLSLRVAAGQAAAEVESWRSGRGSGARWWTAPLPPHSPTSQSTSATRRSAVGLRSWRGAARRA